MTRATTSAADQPVPGTSGAAARPAGSETPARDRVATRRRYLMCRPAHFDVRYSINPWMDPAKPTDTRVALAQWEEIRDVVTALGHTVEVVEPVPGMPDMVFAANSAVVLGDRALVARFRHAERAGEPAAYLRWFRGAGYRHVSQAVATQEGQGDVLVAGGHVLTGHGFRTDPAAHDEIVRVFGVDVTPLRLVDPRFYHLDTALAVLADDLVAYFPGAFDAAGVATLRELFPDAILASEADALQFGLNAVSDGCDVVLAESATQLHAQLRERGLVPHGVDVTELLKAGGGVKCCMLELLDDSRSRPVGGVARNDEKM